MNSPTYHFIHHATRVIVTGLCLNHTVYAAGPPPPAINACKDLPEGSTCHFATPNGTESGICGIANNQWACLPTPSTNPDTTSSNIEVTELGTLISTTNSTLPDTGQTICYNNSGSITCPTAGEPFYGQDAQYQSNIPQYTDNGDGTITDNITGLMWQQDPDFNGDGAINSKDKKGWEDAVVAATSFNLAGYTDWRLPTIKELYSLIDFSGITGTVNTSGTTIPVDAIPYLNTSYFKFAYGDIAAGERYIDAQYWSATQYVSTTMRGNLTAFGVNFADGRIKGYGYDNPDGRTEPGRYVRYVRGNPNYGANVFTDNANGTISDSTTNLMWLQTDSSAFDAGINDDGSLNWEEALAWCEKLNFANYTDWRLPDAKELQSLVDYSRSLKTTNSAAIDPLFQSTLLPDGVNHSGEANYPHYWTSTTHLDGLVQGKRAIYIAFGEARGFMDFGDGNQFYDVHGAGAQRSDLKSGDPTQLPIAQGPQGDIQSTYNYARCVRDATSTTGEYAYFDVDSELLHLPVTDAGDLGLYKATLRLLAQKDDRYTPGFIFELVEVTPTTGTPLASYDLQTKILMLPHVTVGDIVYTAEMIELLNAETMRFVVSALR
jgi:hypothetical protein